MQNADICSTQENNKCVQKFYLENRNERDHKRDTAVDGTILQFYIRETLCGLDSTVLEQGPMASSCLLGNELSDSVKFLDQLNNYKLLKVSAPCILCMRNLELIRTNFMRIIIIIEVFIYLRAY